jgi:hypothetical protein
VLVLEANTLLSVIVVVKVVAAAELRKLIALDLPVPGAEVVAAQRDLNVKATGARVAVLPSVASAPGLVPSTPIYLTAEVDRATAVCAGRID